MCYVLLVGTFSRGLSLLLPVLLTTLEVALKSKEAIQLCDESFVFRTAKSHMTTATITFYLNSILGPCVKSLRDRFFRPEPGRFPDR